MSRVGDDWKEAKAESVSVTNPIKANGYMSYEVRHINADQSVTRRYNDFHNLYKTLKSKFPGSFIPPLPKKKTVGRFSEEFVSTRMRGLQYFLEEVLRSPDFESLDFVRSFWEDIDPKAWSNLARESNSRPRVGWVKRNMNSFKVSKSILQQYADVIENDAVIDMMQDSIEEMLKSSRQCESVSLALLKATDKITVLLAARSRFALNCAELDIMISEEDGGRVDKNFQMLSETDEVVFTRLQHHSSSMNIHFVEPIQRFTESVLCFQKAIRRQNILKEDYIATDVAFHKQHASESDVEDAKNAYEIGVQRVTRDFDRFKEAKSRDVCSYLVGLCHMQMENCKMITLAFGQLEQSLLNHVIHSPYNSDSYKVLSFKSDDRNNLHSGLDADMLADLTHDDEYESEFISV